MTDSDPEPRPVFTPTPLTPRPKLFAALLLIFAAWVAFMVWMYVATVYPARHKASPAAASGKIAPAAASR